LWHWLDKKEADEMLLHLSSGCKVCDVIMYAKLEGKCIIVNAT
jgi:hypothetical protein